MVQLMPLPLQPGCPEKEAEMGVCLSKLTTNNTASYFAHSRKNARKTAKKTRGLQLRRWATGPKSGKVAVSLSVGTSWVPIYHNVTWAEAHLLIKWYPDPSSHLATVDIGHP